MTITTELPVIPQERARGCLVELPPGLDPAAARAHAGVAAALADPARIQMLYALKRASGPLCVCDFTSTLGLSQPTVSHHLARLRAAGLAMGRKAGIWSYWQLAPDLPPAGRAFLDSL